MLRTNEEELLMHACRTGNTKAVEQIINLNNTTPDDIAWAIQTATTFGHVECVNLLRVCTDVSKNSCMLFRWALTKKQVECARLLIPTVHPQLHRSYIYVNEILCAQCCEQTKCELLHLCTNVFNLEEDNSKSLRRAIVLKAQYAVNILWPFSNTTEALDILRRNNTDNVTPSKEFSEYLDELESKFLRENLTKNINPIQTSAVPRKI